MTPLHVYALENPMTEIARPDIKNSFTFWVGSRWARLTVAVDATLTPPCWAVFTEIFTGGGNPVPTAKVFHKTMPVNQLSHGHARALLNAMGTALKDVGTGAFTTYTGERIVKMTRALTPEELARVGLVARTEGEVSA